MVDIRAVGPMAVACVEAGNDRADIHFDRAWLDAVENSSYRSVTDHCKENEVNKELNVRVHVKLTSESTSSCNALCRLVMLEMERKRKKRIHIEGSKYRARRERGRR